MSVESGAAARLQAQIRARLSSLPETAGESVGRETARLARFLELVLEASDRMNLVSASASQPQALLDRHLFDSLFGLAFLPPPGRDALNLLDIGTGGGFPAIPLLIVRTDLRGTLVESTKKKCRFLDDVVRTLSLTAEVVNARFPDTYPMKPPARFDLLTSRALGNAGRLIRLARPLLKPDARALLWTTEPLYQNLVKTGICGKSGFHRAPEAESRGIAVVERFT
jgi:16S rRNA (guanine527-N7)-methyltransferase